MLGVNDQIATDVSLKWRPVDDQSPGKKSVRADNCITRVVLQKKTRRRPVRIILINPFESSPWNRLKISIPECNDIFAILVQIRRQDRV